MVAASTNLRLFEKRASHGAGEPQTDVADAAWIAQLIQHGLVKPSFVPPKDIREARMFTRYRKAQIDERGREAQRLDKVLQDAGVKLSSVATDVLGVSGRAMMAALIEGTRDPQVLSDPAKGKLRSKIPLLRKALDGRFGHVHAVLVAEILAKLEYLDEAIARLSQEIETALAPHVAQLQLLVTIPGIGLRTAQMLTGEFGTDMSHFGSAKALASWAGVCPGNWESAGKSRTGRSRKGPKWLGAALHECAMAAIRSKGSYLHAQYQRLKPRRGHGRAIKVVEHSIIVAIYHMLDRGQPYHDLGADYFTRRNSPDRQAAHHLARLRELGYQVTAEPPAA
ncbi:IS110 family transposase [Streptomyces antibioticus]|uniref:IS110 family transposase n=1 Tax=Streptomyces antibioticus TaxID=1890 RepID=UPI0033F318FF